MGELYFFVTFLTTVVIIVTILIKSIRKKSIVRNLKILSTVIVLYLISWTVSYLRSGIRPVDFGEDICFDDWCATVSSFERLSKLLDNFLCSQSE